MNVWLPNITAGGGADIFVARLARGLRRCGVDVVESRHPRAWLFAPWRLSWEPKPSGTDIAVGNVWWGFAARRPQTKLVVIAHHCVFDPAFARYKSLAQRIVHAAMVRPFERKSFLDADAVVAVSEYTAESYAAAFGVSKPRVILNGIETDFFTPGPGNGPIGQNDRVKLLFVGNLTRRKGADLLPEIMGRLGPGYELHYTSGLRTRDPFRDLPEMRPLGRLGREQLRDAYRGADLLLFPTRLEGFGYTAAEAMACGTPVVTSDCSSMPEVVEDGVTGRLCPVDDVEAFAAAIRELSGDPERLKAMGKRAREAAVARFGLDRMARDYIRLFEELLR